MTKFKRYSRYRDYEVVTDFTHTLKRLGISANIEYRVPRIIELHGIIAE